MTLLHASCVAWPNPGRGPNPGQAQGLLILGPSGAGKSMLALQLMALGAGLVADDQVLLSPRDGGLWAQAPGQIAGMIEARGVGLLGALALEGARLALVVDLGRPEPERLPPRRQISLAGCDLPLVLGAGHGHLHAALLQYLKGGRRA